MANWYYYYNEQGEKIGVTGEQLMRLAKNGEVTQETIIETVEGQTAYARTVKGLTFGKKAKPKPTPKVTPPEAKPKSSVSEKIKHWKAQMTQQDSVGIGTVPPIANTPSVDNGYHYNYEKGEWQEKANFNPLSNMTNYFYTDTNGQRHQINGQCLRELAEQGIIKPNTPLETEEGHKGLAGQIPGLFVAAPSPFTQTGQMAQPPVNLFCTNCGNTVSQQAVACMSCGARPTGHRKFCRHCGVAVNPEQVVCIKCGASLTSNTGTSRFGANLETSGQKSKLVAGLLALFLGVYGGHKFYMGSWGWGIVFIVFVLCTFFIGALVTAIVALVEGVMYLRMTEEAFAEKYPPETEAPFRW